MDNAKSYAVDTRFPGGNAAGVAVLDGETPEIRFTPDPRRARPLWFWFKIVPALTDAAAPAAGKLRLVLDHYETLAGARHPAECAPVIRPAGQWWMRLPSGKSEQTPDGQTCAVWTVNRSSDSLEVALGFPYTDDDARQLLERGRGFWKSSVIGRSSAGNPVFRLANEYAAGTRFTAGLYLIARLRGGDMPAAWALDGILQRLAGAKNNPFAVWAVPCADPDAASAGAWHSMPDLMGDWAAAPIRTELNVMACDLARWRANCRPVLAVNLQAAPLHEGAGIYCELPDIQLHPEAHAQALKWAHVIQHKLGAEFAAPEFIRSTPAGGSAAFHNWPAAGNVCGLTLCVPWSGAGETGFSPKKYREVGRSIADALIEKRR